MVRADEGSYQLVGIGVDFAEFESEGHRLLIPLGMLQMRTPK